MGQTLTDPARQQQQCKIIVVVSYAFARWWRPSTKEQLLFGLRPPVLSCQYGTDVSTPVLSVLGRR